MRNAPKQRSLKRVPCATCSAGEWQYFQFEIAFQFAESPKVSARPEFRTSRITGCTKSAFQISKKGKKWVLIKQILAKLGKMSAIIMHKMSATPLKLSLYHSDFDFSPNNGKNPLGYTHFCLLNLQNLFLGAPNSPPNFQVSYHFWKFKGWLFWGCKKIPDKFLGQQDISL